MAIQITGGNTQERDAVRAWSNFKAAETSFKSKYDGLSGANKSVALNAITNWDFAAAAPTVARENALFVALALLYILVGFIARRYIKNGS